VFCLGTSTSIRYNLASTSSLELVREKTTPRCFASASRLQQEHESSIKHQRIAARARGSREKEMTSLKVLTAAVIAAVPAVAAAPKATFSIDAATGAQTGRSYLRNAMASNRVLYTAVNAAVRVSAVGAASTKPAIAMSTNVDSGAYIVVWQANGQPGKQTNLVGQMFNKVGSVGVEFLIADATAAIKQSPQVVALATGEYVVTWQSTSGSATGYDIYAQVLDSVGNRVGAAPILVNTAQTGPQQAPALAALDDGTVVIVYQSNDEVFAQIIDPANMVKLDGSAEMQVNVYDKGAQAAPSVAAGKNGSFTVAWQSPNPSGTGTGIYARIYAAGAWGAPFAVDDGSLPYNASPSVTAMVTGYTVVVWEGSAGAGAATSSIYGQVYNALGVRTGKQFLASTALQPAKREVPTAVELAAAAPARLVVAWTSTGGQDSDGSGVYSQAFTVNEAGAQPVRLETAVSEEKPGDQSNVALAPLANGAFLALYDSQYSAATAPRISSRVLVVPPADDADVCADVGASCSTTTPCCDAAIPCNSVSSTCAVVPVDRPSFTTITPDAAAPTAVAAAPFYKSTPFIAGIAGGLAGLALLILAVFFGVWRHKRQRASKVGARKVTPGGEDFSLDTAEASATDSTGAGAGTSGVKGAPALTRKSSQGRSLSRSRDQAPAARSATVSPAPRSAGSVSPAR
jgi:hypothetical protein